jgi:hypothetical protein
MGSEKIVHWLQIIGNFGLIAGLGLVAVQIQQNTEITKAQMISEDRGIAVALKLAVLGENPAKAVAKAIDAPSQLTTEDMFVLTSLQLANYYHKSRNEMLYSMGFGTGTHQFSTPDNNAVSSINEFLGTPHGIALWETWKEGEKGGPWENGAPLTGKAIDKALRSYRRPDTILADRYREVQKKLVELGEDVR